ncbi:MAG: DNA polymerase III subunit chi [Rubrivivax sp.]|nr:DNA polymerase III subunit chi [Rubrivivax sp.]
MAARVEFHTGLPDPLGYAARLLRKAHGRGLTALCLAPPPRLEALDRLLWTFAEREFLPHVRLAGAAAAALRRTPIWLSASWSPAPAEGVAARDVVLNLGGEMAPGAAAEVRVIELVGADADEVERGRAAWRRYKAAGFEIVHHPFGAPGG